MPQQINFQDGSQIKYVYDASGVKRRTEHIKSGETVTKDYTTNKVYEGGVLKMVLTEEGYAVPNGSNGFNRYFYLKGRLVVNQSGAIVQSLQYEPFGMTFADGINAGWQPYKFGGKEEETDCRLNWYDFESRLYVPDLGRFMQPDPLAEKYYSVSPYAYCANNPIRNIDLRGDSITVTNKQGDYLFMLDDGIDKMITYTAQQLYSKGIQWFASDADNYMPLIGVADNLSESASLKHFTSDEILAFSEKDRWMIDYRSGGTGDWKKSKQGADGYLMVTVDGKPYWADAVGQVPFAINKFRDEFLKTGGNSGIASKRTIDAGRKYGDGNPLFPQADYSNGYDNAMIQRTVNWASKNYFVGYNSLRNWAIYKRESYNPSSLFNYR